MAGYHESLKQKILQLEAPDLNYRILNQIVSELLPTELRELWGSAASYQMMKLLLYLPYCCPPGEIGQPFSFQALQFITKIQYPAPVEFLIEQQVLLRWYNPLQAGENHWYQLAAGMSEKLMEVIGSKK
jgi:hypothetical protein